ncbi:MAG: phospholipase D family protein [Fluviibacter sp.]
MGLLLAGVLPALAFAQTPVAPVEVPPTKIRAYFTPGHMVENAITDEIVAAKSEIRVQAYSFTNPVIVQALADAQQRGVDVVLVLDKSNRTQKSSAADLARSAGIPTLIDDRHAIAHNKIMIIDDRIVITGSYNFSRAAEKSNAENLVIIESGPIAQKYQQNWQKHHQHSKPFVAGQRTP